MGKLPHRHLFSAATLTLELPRSRSALYRLMLISLLALSLVLIAIDKRAPELSQQIRTSVTSVTLPVINLMTRPAESLTALLQGVEEIALVYTQNQQLRRDNARLQQWQAIAHDLQQENRALARMLHIPFAGEITFRTARVLTGGQGVYANSLMIDMGRAEGLHRYQPVIAREGLVGLLAEPEENRTRVMLLTDINTRIPVRVERTGARAILAGTGGSEMSLLFLEDASQVEAGDRLVTSGDGHTLPAGLPVGVVESAKAAEQITARPLVAAGQLDFVQVLNYRRE